MFRGPPHPAFLPEPSLFPGRSCLGCSHTWRRRPPPGSHRRRRRRPLGPHRWRRRLPGSSQAEDEEAAGRLTGEEEEATGRLTGRRGGGRRALHRWRKRPPGASQAEEEEEEAAGPFTGGGGGGRRALHEEGGGGRGPLHRQRRRRWRPGSHTEEDEEATRPSLLEEEAAELFTCQGGGGHLALRGRAMPGRRRSSPACGRGLSRSQGEWTVALTWVTHQNHLRSSPRHAQICGPGRRV